MRSLAEIDLALMLEGYQMKTLNQKKNLNQRKSPIRRNESRLH
jgi:hypothetical protein